MTPSSSWSIAVFMLKNFKICGCSFNSVIQIAALVDGKLSSVSTKPLNKVTGIMRDFKTITANLHVHYRGSFHDRLLWIFCLKYMPNDVLYST